MRLDVTRARYPNHHRLIAQRGRGMAWFHGNGMAWFHGKPLQDGEGLGEGARYIGTFAGKEALKAASKEFGKKLNPRNAAYAAVGAVPGAVARAGGVYAMRKVVDRYGGGRVRKRPRF